MPDEQAGEASGQDGAPVAEGIRETDIVFDCPHCEKSLAIDFRGAGLMITCPDCGNRIQVPIPDGMDVSDLDSSQEDQRVRVIHLREALADAQRLILELQDQVSRLQQRAAKLEAAQAESKSDAQKIIDEVARVRRGQDEINMAAERMAELAKRMTQDV